MYSFGEMINARLLKIKQLIIVSFKLEIQINYVHEIFTEINAEHCLNLNTIFMFIT